MGEPYLTMAEIEKRYPNEWVLIEKPRKQRKPLKVLGGHVIFHTTDRDDLDRRLVDLPREVGDIAVFFMGDPAPDEVWMLNA